jgi:transposase
LVADPRRVQLITKDPRKTDRRDAETLARLAAAMPEVLGAIRHRGEQAQADLSVIRVRDLLVEARSSIVLQVRGLAKAFGTRLPTATTQAFPKRVRATVPEKLQPAVEPALEAIDMLTQKIRELDDKLDQIAEDRYPKTAVLRQIRGVGPLTSLAFVLTIEDASRFAKSRQVGSWLGLCPRSFASGESVPQLPITKAGDGTLRRLLVQCAQYILGPFGEDCDLRRFGKRLAARGGRAAKKRAVVAVARKLAILLHLLWRTGAVYDPLYHANRLQAAPAV